MNSSFSIETQWIDNITQEDEETATTCAMKILANDVCLTKNAILSTNRYTDEAILSAYPVAQWVCSSWWRLAYEPVPSNDLARPHDWRMTHELAAAGSGYVWPAITIVPDGNEVTIFSAHKNEQDVSAESLLYIGAERQRVSLPVFLNSLEVFVPSVIDRMTSFSICDTDLSVMWAQLQAEKDDEQQKLYRIVEARLGFDPDQCPPAIMKKISKAFSQFDDDTGLEFASQCSRYESQNFDADIDKIAIMAKKGIPGEWYGNNFSAEYTKESLPPWEYGRTIARSFRNHLKKTTGKIDSSVLHNLLGVTPKNLKDAMPNDAPFSLSHIKNNKLRINIKKESSGNYTTGLRFQLARLVGACLSTKEDEHWLPITACKTWAQMVQRAFATEFLSPIAEVRDVVGGIPSEKSITKAAKHFQVSPQTILHGLANHGDIDRADLWQYAF